MQSLKKIILSLILSATISSNSLAEGIYLSGSVSGIVCSINMDKKLSGLQNPQGQGVGLDIGYSINKLFRVELGISKPLIEEIKNLYYIDTTNSNFGFTLEDFNASKASNQISTKPFDNIADIDKWDTYIVNFNKSLGEAFDGLSNQLNTQYTIAPSVVYLAQTKAIANLYSIDLIDTYCGMGVGFAKINFNLIESLENNLIRKISKTKPVLSAILGATYRVQEGLKIGLEYSISTFGDCDKLYLDSKTEVTNLKSILQKQINDVYVGNNGEFSNKYKVNYTKHIYESIRKALEDNCSEEEKKLINKIKNRNIRLKNIVIHSISIKIVSEL